MDVFFGIFVGNVMSLLFSWLIYWFFIRAAHERRIQALEKQIKVLPKQSVSQSRSTIKGQLAEQLYPILPGCKYLTSDMKFFGAPFDYIIIDGYTEAKDDNGEIREIIFADIKQGNSRLSSHQKKIRDAIEAGKVRWETIHISPTFEVQ